MESLYTDEYFMKEALKEAQKAFDVGEVPVGAVVVSNNRVIARGHNLTERLIDVTAHAEIMAITAASGHLGSKYLDDCTLYVSLEPCLMCAGAIFHARPSRLVWGAADEKRGFTLINNNILHPKTTISMGIMAAESRLLLQEFFNQRRG